VAVGHEWAHAKGFGQRQRHTVLRFALGHLRRIGLGADGAQLAEPERFEPALAVPPGQCKRLARMLPGLLTASLEETDRAEPRDVEGLIVQGPMRRLSLSTSSRSARPSAGRPACAHI
jgi:hypothetical protein